MKVEVEMIRKMVAIDTLVPGDCFTDGSGEVEMIVDLNSMFSQDKDFPVVSVNLCTGKLNCYKADVMVVKRKCKLVNDDE